MRKILIIFALISFLFSCQNTDKEDFDMSHPTQTHKWNANYLQLRNDSTELAGTLYLTARSSELKLKWNMPASCNIDTTTTLILAENGRCELPIRWNKKDVSGSYAPNNVAFDAGVLITDGESSRYVRLLWSSTVDSIAVEDESIRTRAGEALPKAVTITVEPPTVDMDIVQGGYCLVTFNGTNIVSIDQQHILEKNNVDKTKIPLYLRTGGDDIVLFQWNDKGAPNWNFDDYLTFKAGGLDLYILRVRYNVPVDINPVWDFVKADIPDGSYLPSTGATLQVTAKTNTSWSVESPLQIAAAIDNGGNVLQNKTLAFLIEDNKTTDIREVTVTAKSNPVVNKQQVLTYYQLGNNQAGIFDFLGSDPVAGSHLSAEENKVKITVRADIPWYISCGCLVPGREDYTPDGLQTYTEEFTVPANTTGISQLINVKISDRFDRYTKNIQFIQDATGGGENPGPGTGGIYSVIISPQGDISEYETELKVAFQGNYTGNIDVRAIVGTEILASASGKANTSIPLTIPQLFGFDRTVIFEYSIDGGTNWIEIERRKQVNETFAAGLIMPRSQAIPVSGQGLSWSYTGTYSRPVTWRALSSGVTLVEQTAKGPNLSIIVPANTTAASRRVDFQYMLEGGMWITMEYRTQAAQ